MHTVPQAFLNCVHALQVVYGHLEDPETSELVRGQSYLKLRPGAPSLPQTEIPALPSRVVCAAAECSQPLLIRLCGSGGSVP